MSKRYFEFVEGTSSKFWEVWVEGAKVFTRYGKIGASGQVTVKDEGSPDAAQKLHDKLVREKTGKGYAEKGGSTPAAPAPAPAAVAKKVATKVAKKVAPAAAPKKSEVPAGAIRLEFKEGGSAKFWQIQRQGDAFTVTYGKIGTPGQVQKKKFKSEWEARRAHDALVAEKTKKGYQPVVSGAAPSTPTTVARDEALERAIVERDGADDGFLVYADFLSGQGDVRGELATLQGQLAKKKDKKLAAAVAKLLWDQRVHFYGPWAAYLSQSDREYGTPPLTATWRWGFMDELTLSASTGWASGAVSIPTVRDAGELVRSIPKVDSARFVRSLTIAIPVVESECRFANTVKELVKAMPSMPLLRRLTLGDFTYEDTELSWSYLGKLDALWPLASKLEYLKLRAGEMSLGTIVAPALKEFRVETGGLSKASLSSICRARWPQLETLHLWFGQDEYGCDCSASDVQPILDGTGLGQLKHLGLANSTFGDELVALLVKSKIARQLETLDLSMSHLTDVGIDALVAGKANFPKLQKLDVSRCLLGPKGVKAAKAMAKIVEAKNQEDPSEYSEEDYRYSAVGE